MENMETRIREVMAHQVHTVRVTATLHDAAVRMWSADIAVLPVLDPIGQVVGMITDRDITMAAARSGLRLTELDVESTMSSPVWACAPDDPVEAVETKMRVHGVRRLPVIDRSARLVGIVSVGDIARAAAPV